jgi:hypothetical protein
MQAAEMAWQGWFQQAGYVWLDPADHGLPWINSLYNYLGANYQRIPLPGDDPDQRGGLFLRISSVAIHHRQHHHRHRAGDAMPWLMYR